MQTIDDREVSKIYEEMTRVYDLIRKDLDQRIQFSYRLNPIQSLNKKQFLP